MGPILILNIMAENDSNMIDLVLTHLTHPWGPPWTLATLGDPWRPLATLGDMPENGHFWGKCPFSGAQKWDFECPNPKSETTFSRQHPPKMVEWVFVLFIYHFWTRNRQILNCEHFELVLARFYSVKRDQISKIARCHNFAGKIPIPFAMT